MHPCEILHWDLQTDYRALCYCSMESVECYGYYNTKRSFFISAFGPIYTVGNNQLYSIWLHSRIFKKGHTTRPLLFCWSLMNPLHVYFSISRYPLYMLRVNEFQSCLFMLCRDSIHSSYLLQLPLNYWGLQWNFPLYTLIHEEDILNS